MKRQHRKDRKNTCGNIKMHQNGIKIHDTKLIRLKINQNNGKEEKNTMEI